MSSRSVLKSGVQTNLTHDELRDTRQKVRHLTVKLRDLQPFLDDLQRSQMLCIRIIITQLQEIRRLGAMLHNQETYRVIDILQDHVRRNENSLVFSFSHGTPAQAIHREIIFPPNAIVDDLYEYHSDDEQ